MSQNFSTGRTVKTSKELTSEETAPPDFIKVGNKAAAVVIDSGSLGDGPYSVQVSGNIDEGPGMSTALTVTVTAVNPTIPVAPVPV